MTSSVVMPARIKVLVVDDSAVVRQVLIKALSGSPDIEVVGTAPDPYVARDLIVKLKPDVLTLDIEMPRMDGLSFLAKLMQHRPMPVVVISSLSPEGSEEAMRALELGAVDVLCKPGSAYSVLELGPLLARSIRAAAQARLPARRVVATPTPLLKKETGTVLGQATSQILVFGASTGGTTAIRDIMGELPANTPGTVIVQHMPPLFTAAFAKHLNAISAMSVVEAQGGEELRTGLALVAPGGHHLVVVRSGERFVTELRRGPQVHYQRPAVDVTFRSVAQAAGTAACGVLLTGMGVDGAAGLLAMRTAGGLTLAQDEASCVVYGMPKAAVELDAAMEVTALSGMAKRIRRRFGV